MSTRRRCSIARGRLFVLDAATSMRRCCSVHRGRLFVLGFAVGTVACASPEATRERGGDRGADPGNRNVIVEMHKGAEPYHQTPCRMTDVECPNVEILSGREARRAS